MVLHRRGNHGVLSIFDNSNSPSHGHLALLASCHKGTISESLCEGALFDQFPILVTLKLCYADTACGRFLESTIRVCRRHFEVVDFRNACGLYELESFGVVGADVTDSVAII